MDRLKDAAMLLKAKLTKDQTQELLIQATSEQNWQTPTPILHEICNIAYNYEEWQKIQSFIWEKLKMKKWRKVLKTLNMVEFLLKNGPASILSSFKHEVYVFRSLDSFTCLDEGVDRGEAIRERAKSIVQLLSNEQLLEEERTKAKAIKERMGESAGSGSTYKGVGSKGFGTGPSKYESYDNKGKGKSGSGYGSSSYGSSSYGGGSSGDYETSYGSGSSNLNKYKKDLAGESAYKKTTEQKKQEKPERQQETKKTIVEDKNEDEGDKKNPPKPFNQQGRKLLKPGEAPTPSVPTPAQNTKNKGTNNTTTNKPSQQPSTSQTGGGGFNFFDEEPPVQPQTKPIQPQNVNIQAPTPTQQGINFGINQTSPQQLNTSLPFGQFQFPQQTTTSVPQVPPASQTGPNLYGVQNISQPQPNLGFNFNFNPTPASTPTPQTNIGYQSPPQPTFPVNTQPTVNQGLLGLGNITTNPKPTPNNQMFSMNTTTNKEDEFGVFNQGHKQITWMSADQSSLVGLDDLSKQVNEKNVAKDKKKSPNEGNLLATSQDFDFMSAPSSNYNLGINFGVQNPKGNIMMGGYPAPGQWHGQGQYQQQANNQLGGISFF